MFVFAAFLRSLREEPRDRSAWPAGAEVPEDAPARFIFGQLSRRRHEAVPVRDAPSADGERVDHSVTVEPVTEPLAVHLVPRRPDAIERPFEPARERSRRHLEPRG